MVCLAALLLLLAHARPVDAQVRGLSYTLTPMVERIYFDEDAALGNTLLYGGALGFSFGRYVELQALYQFRDDVTTDLTRLSGLQQETRDRLAEIPQRTLGLQRYGGALKINLPTGSARPFVSLGAGLLRFEPEDLNSSRTIYLSGGAGIQLTAGDRYALSVGVENLSYRYNLGATLLSEQDLATAGLESDNFRQTLVSNWAGRAALQVYLGGRAPGEATAIDEALREQFSGGLRGISLRIEPFGSRINFDEALTYRTQRTLGLYAGINVGPYLGLRAFYWRGVEDDATFINFDDIQAFGGEMRFRLGEGRTLTPYLSFGGGYLDVLSGYEGRFGPRPESEPFVLAGGGVIFPLTDAVVLNGGARSMLISDPGIDNVAGPGDVHASWTYSVGVNFALGGDAPPTAGDVFEERLAGAQAEQTQREEVLQAELRRLRARLDSLEGRPPAADVPLQAAAEPEARPEAADTPAATIVPEVEEPTSNLSDRTLTVPVPAEGEIYLRYGDGAGTDGGTVYPPPVVVQEGRAAQAEDAAAAGDAEGLTAEEIRQIVQSAVRDQTRGLDRGDDDTAESLRAIEQRLSALEGRIERRLDAEVDRLWNALQDGRDEPAAVVVDRDGETRVVPQTSQAADVREVPGRLFRIRGVMPYVGVRTGVSDDKVLVGMRAHLSLPQAGLARFMPEVDVGFGEGALAFAAIGNVTTPFARRFVRPFQPYAGAGVGLLTESGFDGLGLALNLLGGIQYPLGSNAVFAEYSTLDFFDYHRVLLGVRVRF